MKLFKFKEKSSKEKILDSQKKIKAEKKKIKEEEKKIKVEKKKIKDEKRKEKLVKKKELKKEKIYTQREMIITIIISMITGVIVLFISTYIFLSYTNILSSYKDLSDLIDTYATISRDYYGKYDKEEMIDNAINAMINTIDDTFTTYTDKDQTDDFLEEVEGTYEGIGCSISQTLDNEIIVVEIFEDSPAEKAGLQEGDIIKKIDGESYENKTNSDMAEYVKNSQNKSIKLTILRDEKEIELEIQREKIEIQSVLGEIIEQDNHKVGYISISLFSSVSYKQFKEELKSLEKENIEGLIIDVRDNGGGYLTSVTDISEMFLTKGQVIYQLKNGKKTEKVKDETTESRNYQVAVLINENSASASEILASAIKESYKGLVVGVNSYGKGTVQQTKKLTDGSMVKYTTQNWLTPNGNWVNDDGVEPTNYLEYDYESEIDNQLSLAINLIIEKLK